MKTKRPTEKNNRALLTPVKGAEHYVLHGWFPTDSAAFGYARRAKLNGACIPCLLEPVSNTPAELESRLAPWLTPAVQK